MIWGAIEWGYKSKLVFLNKLSGANSICSTAYTQQVLETEIRDLLMRLEEGIEGTIVMKDSAKVHMRYANTVWQHLGIKGFHLPWSPSNSDLNSIEKVWWWMKGRITEMNPFPSTLSELKCMMQKLWDEMNSTDYISHIEKTHEKLLKVIKKKKELCY